MFEGQVENLKIYSEEDIRKLRVDVGMPVRDVLRVAKIKHSKFLELKDSWNDEEVIQTEGWKQRNKWFSKTKKLVDFGICLEKIEEKEKEFAQVLERMKGVEAYPKLGGYKELSSSEIGNAAEQLVKYRLARCGFEFLEPPSYYKSCDVIVRNIRGEYKRCEVKGSSAKYIRFTRTTRIPGGSGMTQRSPYSIDEDIDFFICVCLVTEQMFILPQDEVVEGRDSFSLNLGSPIYQFKDRYDLLYGEENGKEEKEGEKDLEG